jgi:hypothetical protein
LRPQYEQAEVADGLSPRDPLLADNVRRLASLPLAHQPGGAWTYGLNTDVLGRVIEVASGQPLDEYFSEKIFRPLQMTDTSFAVPVEKRDRLVAIYKPAAEGKKVVRVDADPETAGTVVYSGQRVLSPQYLSGGAGLVSSASDYARFLQMLLGAGRFEGARLLSPESVRAMTTNQIGQLESAYGIHGNKFGLGFGITSRAEPAAKDPLGSVASAGSYSWGGIYHTFFWVDPQERLVALVMAQLFPWGDSTLWSDYQAAVYQDLRPPEKKAPADKELSHLGPPHESSGSHASSGRFQRRFWFEPGLEYGNPTTNRRFRVNDPLVALHPRFGLRSEVLGNGLLQIKLDEWPFRVRWETKMLPAQREMAARAVVRFKDLQDLVYLTPPLTGLATVPRTAEVHRFAPAELPRPFWSRDNRLKSCRIAVDLDPSTVETSELRVVLWDGGGGKTESPLKFNHQPLPFRSDAKHDVKSLRLPIDPSLIVKGENVFEVLSDTEHHGIEILLPGPELWVRTKS